MFSSISSPLIRFSCSQQRSNITTKTNSVQGSANCVYLVTACDSVRLVLDLLPHEIEVREDRLRVVELGPVSVVVDS